MRQRDTHGWMWGEALSLLEQAERLQRAFFRPSQSESSWEPPIDIMESPDALFVHVALPGVSAEAIAIGIECAGAAPVLTISASREFPLSARGARLHRVEIPYGRFFRRVALPSLDARVRLEPAGRSYIDGCLTLVLRKRVAQQEPD